MSDEFEVEVLVTCDRTKKTHKIPMTLEEAGTHKKRVGEKGANAEEIRSFLGGIPHPRPDLVVMFRGEIVVLPTVVDKKDATLMRLLSTLTNSPTFPAPPVKPRKKSSKNGKRESAPPTVQDSAPAE
jgi:hypothetical protein